MLDLSLVIYEIIVWGFLLYSLAILILSVWTGVYAYGAISRYRHENTLTDYNLIATNPNAPAFSIIAPAYNEGKTIVENVRSLLSVYYHNLEIIIVNDGSKDDSIEQLIQAYELEAVPFYIQGNLSTKPVKAIYKSKNPAFKKLVVVDKENGGKADALNVGVNISSGEYVVCIDVDCILEQDALLKMAKPFLEQTGERLIACGGAIRLANNCRIEKGKVVEVNLPKTLLGRMQALEYIRAFILGHMAWSRASGLILISGAFGAFDKQVVLACGGYDPATVGEDMELVVRMRRYMEEQKIPYKVISIPDPLCWTEVPESKEILKRQRNRWMRGTIETLRKHRKLFFNTRYGKLGMISYPYWLFFEFLGPLVEFSGYIIFFLFLFLGIINWSFFLALLCLVLFSGILYSIYAILIDLLSYQVYTKRRDLSKLIFAAFLEPIYFHPLVVLSGVRGVVDYFRKKHSWGDMTRQGFSATVENLPLHKRIGAHLSFELKTIAPLLLAFLSIYILLVGAEVFWYQYKFASADALPWYTILFAENLVYGFQLVFGLSLIYLLVSMVYVKLARLLLISGSILLLFTHVLLAVYFSESLNLLGADLRYYSSAEIEHTLSSAGMLSWKNAAFVFLLLVALTLPFYLVSKRSSRKVYVAGILLLCGLISFFVPLNRLTGQWKPKEEFWTNVSTSKLAYFNRSLLYDFVDKNEYIQSAKTYLYKGAETENIDPYFPFLKDETTRDVLGPYFSQAVQPPNLVFIIVEGLGHAYSSPKGYIGNFTPFLDSLAGHSLYWENALSSSGRTFSVLPTLMGSLPFAANGFLEQPVFPDHFNLLNVLKKSGFQTGFFYGGNADFDNMRAYLQFNHLDRIIEERNFESVYKRLPEEKKDESWGFDDQSLFGKYLEETKEEKQPYLNILLTLSTHSPFLINNTAVYEDLFDRRLKSLPLSPAAVQAAVQLKKQLITIMNVDDAIRQFMDQYKKRPDFSNTIFIITGDHSMPEIPLSSKIDRYHVPLIIYSPLLKAGKQFNDLVSHFDVAPSILAYYNRNYNLKIPSKVTWLGGSLADKGNTRAGTYPIMQSKSKMDDFVSGSYHLVADQLFKISPTLDLDPVPENTPVKDRVRRSFAVFKRKNAIFIQRHKLLPDSVYNGFMKGTSFYR